MLTDRLTVCDFNGVYGFVTIVVDLWIGGDALVEVCLQLHCLLRQQVTVSL